MTSRILRLIPCVFAAFAPFAKADLPTFASWAERPVMGWNSWNFYGTSIDEAKAKANADYMAANLLPFGYNVFTVDIQWYQPTATGFNYDPNATLVMDQWGRLLPATNRFPSAADGAGFKPLGDYIRAKGMKFGIHIMRGIPRQAWEQNLPVKGTTATARDIAITTSICSWNPDMYGVDVSKPAGQAYYDSLFELYASWGVDFIKVDDLSRPYDSVQKAEVEAIRKAIDKTGRPIILSTSPGETPLSAGPHVMQYANQWRISDDFWDTWAALFDQFRRLHDWTPFRAAGRFPDADMLPLGKLAGGSPTHSGRPTFFTQDEQYTLMSLWSIARSPLIHGGDMTQMDPFTLSLLTNEEVIAVNQRSTHNRQLFRNGDLIAWVADPEDSPDKYLAVFNTGAAAAQVPVDLAKLGFTGTVQIRSLWQKSDLGGFNVTFSPSVPSHGAALYRLSGPGLPTPWITTVTPGDRQVTVEWETVPNAISYRVKRATAENGPFEVVAENLTVTSHTDANLQNGTTYFYVISTMIGAAETPDSGAVSTVPIGLPGTISWNYDRFGDVFGTRVAGIEPVVNWNNSYPFPGNPTLNLIDNTGTATTVDISYSSFNDWTVNNPQTWPGMDADGTYNRHLLNGYLNAGYANWGPPQTFSRVVISEIGHPSYDVIVYFSSDVSGRAGDVTDGTTTYSFNTVGPASVTGANAVFAQTTDTAGTYATTANYAVFSGLSGPSQTITVQMRDTDAWGGIAGFQIVPRNPDPDNYSAWIARFPDVGALDGFDDDPDGDGMKNGTEAFFGTDPGTASRGIEEIHRSGNTVTFRHPQNASPPTGVTAQYVWSTDLQNFHAHGQEVGGTTVAFTTSPDTPSAGTTTVTTTITGTVPEKLFVSLKAALDTGTDDTQGTVVTYAAPEGSARSYDYELTAQNAPVDLYGDSNWWGNTVSFGYFDFSGTIRVSLRPNFPFSTCKILPESLGITPTVAGNEIEFTLAHPEKLTLVFDENYQGKVLCVFANAPETDIPEPSDPGVVYFGPGFHDLKGTANELVTLTSGQTLYIAGGAVVNARILIADASDVVIRGRGIVTMNWRRQEANYAGDVPIIITDSQRVALSGIIVNRRTNNWSGKASRSRDVSLTDYKVVSPTYTSTDGFDIINCQDVTFDDCFFHVCDDNIAIKGIVSSAGTGYLPDDDPALGAPNRNIAVRNCQFWSDANNAIVLGQETQALSYENISVVNCDILSVNDHHADMGAISIVSLNGTGFSNILFENIRVGRSNRLINLYFTDFWYNGSLVGNQNHAGFMSGITFRNITAAGAGTHRIRMWGWNENKRISNVLLDQVRINGTCIASLNDPRFDLNGFVDSVAIAPCMP